MATAPLTAALRAERPPTANSEAAMASQSTEWLASPDTWRSGASMIGVRVRSTAR